MLPKPLDVLWLQYALAVGLAMLGGIVRMLVSNDTHTVLGIIRNLLIAAFGGLMGYLLSTGQGISDHAGLFICGMTGLAGVEGLRTLGRFYAASLRPHHVETYTGIFVDTKAPTDIFAGTKASSENQHSGHQN